MNRAEITVITRKVNVLLINEQEELFVIYAASEKAEINPET